MPNPGVTTLATIRTTAQQQADMVNSSFITNAEWLNYINGSYFELYNLLVQTYENYYSALDTTNKAYQVTTDGTNDMYSLPDGSSSFKMPDGTTNAPAFFKGYGVDLWISATSTQPAQWFTLHRFNYGERNRWTVASAVAPYGYIGLKYRFEATKLWLRPFPQASQLIQIRYAPRLTPLASDSDTADLVSGWEEYITVDCVIKAKLKEESDASGHMARKAELKQEIIAAAATRDPGEPCSVVDVTGMGYYGFPGGGSSDGGIF